MGTLDIISIDAGLETLIRLILLRDQISNAYDIPNKGSGVNCNGCGTAVVAPPMQFWTAQKSRPTICLKLLGLLRGMRVAVSRLVEDTPTSSWQTVRPVFVTSANQRTSALAPVCQLIPNSQAVEVNHAF